jgi:hypothetical protein
MEKFQIAKYGLMQVTALVYGILASGAAVKWNKPFADQGQIMPDSYYVAAFFRDYGFCFFGIIVIWTVSVSYLSSPFSKWEMEEETLAYSGMILAIILALTGTFVAFGGAIHPVLDSPVILHK